MLKTYDNKKVDFFFDCRVDTGFHFKHFKKLRICLQISNKLHNDVLR